jgi:hypothetical protein
MGRQDSPVLGIHERTISEVILPHGRAKRASRVDTTLVRIDVAKDVARLFGRQLEDLIVSFHVHHAVRPIFAPGHVMIVLKKRFSRMLFIHDI